MMKFFFITIPLLISPLMGSELKSSDFKTPVLTISEINKGSLTKGLEPMCTTNPLDHRPVKENPSILFNQCAIDLCGPPEENKSGWITDKNFPDTLTWWSTRKIKKQAPLMNGLFDVHIKKKQQELNTLKDFIKNPQLLSSASIKAKSIIANDVLRKYTVSIPHPEATSLDKKIEIKIAPPKNATPAMVKALEKYAVNLQKTSLTNPADFKWNSPFSDADMKTITNNVFAKVKASADQYPEALDSQSKNLLRMIEELLKEPRLRGEYEKQLLILNTINESIADKSKNNVLNSAVCDDPDCISVYKDYLENPVLIKSINTYEKLLALPETKQNAINRCKASIILNETKIANNQKAQDIFKMAKESIIKNVFPRFSEHSRAIMLNYLNNKIDVSAKHPNSIDNKMNYIKMFNEKASNYIKMNKGLVTVDDASAVDSINQLANEFDRMNPLPDTSYSCGLSSTPTNLWDSFLAKAPIYDNADEAFKKTFDKLVGDNDHIFISDFACQNTAHGHYLIAHEIGHALNYLFLTSEMSKTSAALHKKTRDCVVSNHPNAFNAPDGSRKFPNDKLYTEEDMADLFASVSNPDDKKIYSCAFLPPSLTANVYPQLDFILNNDDLHSSGFARVIQEANNKGIPLSNNCQKLIEREKPDMRFNKCL